FFTQVFGFDRKKAVKVFCARAEKDSKFAWSPALVELLRELPADKSVPLLRKLWDKGGLEESILLLLAERPEPADRARFIHGLGSPQLSRGRLCLEALAKLPPQKVGMEALAVVRALRGLPEEKEANAVREQLAKQLQLISGQEGLGLDKTAWSE